MPTCHNKCKITIRNVCQYIILLWKNYTLMVTYFLFLARNINWRRRRLGTIDLIRVTCSVYMVDNIFSIRMSWSKLVGKRKSTVLGLPFSRAALIIVIQQNTDFSNKISFSKQEKRVPSNNGPFERLPREVILHIFKYLNLYTLVQCCQVCKLFYQVKVIWSRKISC
jgi:hypothetical protein